MATSPAVPQNAIKVFFSYAHKDEKLRNELANHLSGLKQQGIIADWHDRRIIAGTQWTDAIDTHLQTAHIILLLISADFMASEYCNGIEMKRAMARHDAREACVIPIILRPVDWPSAPFGKLQALPTDGRPITSWPNQDEAFFDVARGIRAVAEEMTRQPYASPPHLASAIYTTPTISAVATQAMEIEITIDIDFESYTGADQEHFLRAIGEFLKIERGDIRITRKRPGSVKLTIEIPPDKAEELLWAIKSGQFDEYGVVDATLETNEHHRENEIYVKGEGLISLVDRNRNTASSQRPINRVDTTRMIQFKRIFERSDDPMNQQELDTWKMNLTELGKCMREYGDGLDSPIPAGYTYLMQFINHDLSFNKQKDLLDSQLAELDNFDINQQVYPSLSLDSIYGFGLQDPRILYEGKKFKIGKTSPYKQGHIDIDRVFEHDLPRMDQKAKIANSLNDQNLILAQTHVVFLKFHNCLVDELKKEPNFSTLSNEEIFEEVRKKVTQHFQAIILYDALPRLVDARVYQEVVHEGVRKFIWPNTSTSQPTSLASDPRAAFVGSSPDEPTASLTPGQEPQQAGRGLPVEFSLAAFRFGHSMVRARYSLNDVLDAQFRDGGKLEYLFKFSNLSGNMNGFATLPSPWLLDWNRFYDFHEGNGGSHHKQLNFARAIDTNMVRELHRLPGEDREGRVLSSLAARDLLIGHTALLATGQTVARAMGIEPFTQNPDAYNQLPKLQRDILEELKLKDEMPLWYYILAESAVTQQGKKLGTVGSRIVVETLHSLIETSEHSILRQERQNRWQSELKTENADKFSMVELLKFIAEHSEQHEHNPQYDELNPLGGVPLRDG